MSSTENYATIHLHDNPTAVDQLNRFGVGERVTLDFDVMPIGTPMPDTVWSLSGTGQLLDNGAIGERGDYWAGTDAGQATFTLAVTSGASKGKSVNSSAVSIHVPNPATEVKDTDRGDEHVAHVASAGFAGIISLQPKNVSFRATQFAEVNVAATKGTGDLSYFLTHLHMPDHEDGYANWDDIGIDATYGNVTTFPTGVVQPQGAIAEDAVGFAVPPNAAGGWAAGDGEYDIPWQYRVRLLDGTQTSPQPIVTMAQTAHLGSDGSASIKKDQAFSGRVINDLENDFLGLK